MVALRVNKNALYQPFPNAGRVSRGFQQQENLAQSEKTKAAREGIIILLSRFKVQGNF
jgi:hypothetical protein